MADLFGLSISGGGGGDTKRRISPHPPFPKSNIIGDFNILFRSQWKPQVLSKPRAHLVRPWKSTPLAPCLLRRGAPNPLEWRRLNCRKHHRDWAMRRPFRRDPCPEMLSCPSIRQRTGQSLLRPLLVSRGPRHPPALASSPQHRAVLPVLPAPSRTQNRRRQTSPVSLPQSMPFPLFLSQYQSRGLLV